MNRLILAVLLAGGCAKPAHIQYDHGRAFTQAARAQADLTRPSVANEEYVLYGIEGTKIRLLVEQATTVAKSGAIELAAD